MPARLDKDQELIRKAQRGDTLAFGELYECCAPVIFRYLYTHLDSRMDAEDLTGEVFLKAWQSLPKYNERGVPFLAFLFRIARNVLVDHYRQSNRNTSKTPEELDGFKDESHTELIETVGSQIEHQRILQVLSGLRPDYRSVLTLRFISELSPEETAKVMERSVGAIRVLQHRALAALRQEIEKLGQYEQRSTDREDYRE
jgi:RNA polymerase sigma-70 factor (ECF subfamily)